MNLLQRLFGWGEEASPEWEGIDLPSGMKKKIKRSLRDLQPYKRTAYIPKVEEGHPAFSPNPKIGGFPYLRSPSDWPTCPNCGNHLQLFLQLDMETLPEKASEGLVQLFYCTNRPTLCAEKLEAFFPFSKAVVARRVSVAGESAQITPVIDAVFPEKRIVGWEPKADYPHYEELMSLGVEIPEKRYYVMEDIGMGIPLMGDKLFGWPHWIQSPEYPQDRSTGNHMELLFQLDSEVNLPFMFGDMGIGHLTQSPDNPEELAFGWACT